MVQKSNFVLPQIRAFLTDDFGQIAYKLQVIFLIDRSTLKFYTDSLIHFLEHAKIENEPEHVQPKYLSQIN